MFRTALGIRAIQDLDLTTLNSVFEPDNDIQQIRYKRAFGKTLGAKRDFVIMKGQIGQQEHVLANSQQIEMNPEVGFKCLHYSVTENAGTVKVQIINFTDQVQFVGCKTE